MSKLIIFLAAVAFSTNIVLCQKPWEPTPRSDDQNWMSRHASFVQNSAENGENMKIVFIGSSLVDFWSTSGREIWDNKYAPLGSINYGISGDRTENVLWRIINGEFDSISPKMVVVYVSSNNIPTSATTDEIVRGVTTIFNEIHLRVPQTQILYVEIFPRADGDIDSKWKRATEVNGKVNKYVKELGPESKITTFSLFWDLAESWGVLKTELYVTDNLHLNANGYSVWDASWNTTFHKLLES